MREKWLLGLPDDFPDMPNEDPEQVAKLRELHATVKRLDGEILRRKQTLFEQHGIMFQSQNDHEMRLNLLIDMFIGTLSEERLQFEIRWTKLVQSGIEEGYAQFLEHQRQQREGKTLLLPGLGEHHIPAPPKEKNDGQSL